MRGAIVSTPCASNANMTKTSMVTTFRVCMVMCMVMSMA